MTSNASISEALQLAEMSAEEARSHTEAIRSGLAEIRIHLLEMYNRKGWEPLGYNSWHQYLVHEFPHINYTYLHRQTNAALLEAEWSIDGKELVGSNKESHLRPLLETLPDISYRTLAYQHALNNLDGPPTAESFRIAAYEIYLCNFAKFTGLTTRYYAGEIGTIPAYKIHKELERIASKNGSDNFVEVAEHVSDPELIPILLRLYQKDSDTWQEIYLSRTIPAYPEPIPIQKAAASNLLAWLDEASAEHKAIARMNRHEYYSAIKATLNEMAEAVRSMRDAPDSPAFFGALKEAYLLLDKLDNLVDL